MTSGVGETAASEGAPTPRSFPPALGSAALRELLDLATGAKRWHLVGALGQALDALDAASAPGKVTRLDDRRRGR